MKITLAALRTLLREALEGDTILSERPWSVEVEFKLEGGDAVDSEGRGPDGFEVLMRCGAVEASVVVDSYWNPQSGDASGNALRFQVGGETVGGGETYVPVRFDDGRRQRLVVSNSPVAGMLTVAHTPDDSLPVVYLVVPTPFQEMDGDEIDFEVQALGEGEVDARIVDHVNL